MKKDRAFVDHLLELLAGLGGVTARAMFGGWGVYKDGVMMGLVADGVFYLKTDEINRPQFEEAGLGPFTYETSTGKKSVMSYHEIPERALEDDRTMHAWARTACEAALRAAAKKSPARKRATSKSAQKKTRRKGGMA